MSAAVPSFEEEVRRVIRAKFGIARVLRFCQVQAVMRAANVEHSNDALMKQIHGGQLKPVKCRLPKMRPRYHIDAVVRMIQGMSGEG